jgi:hypothetical protein
MDDTSPPDDRQASEQCIASQLQSFDTTIAKHPSNAPPRDFNPPDVRDS